jgi:hypothetical protein
MKNKLFWSLVLIMLMSLSAWWSAHAELQKTTHPLQVWEYQEVELDARIEATPKLNQLGGQGWELVGVTSSCPSSPSTLLPCRYWAYFKRPR